MRYQAANRRELNELAEAHHERTREVSAEELAEREAEMNRVLDSPPVSLGQVLVWCSDVFPASGFPTNAHFDAVQALPPTTTLAEVLKHLGADLSEYGR